MIKLLFTFGLLLLATRAAEEQIAVANEAAGDVKGREAGNDAQKSEAQALNNSEEEAKANNVEKNDQGRILSMFGEQFVQTQPSAQPINLNADMQKNSEAFLEQSKLEAEPLSMKPETENAPMDKAEKQENQGEAVNGPSNADDSATQSTAGSLQANGEESSAPKRSLIL